MTHLDPIQNLAPAWGHLCETVMVRGEGVRLFDSDGKRYLDFTSGIGVASTGHCHPAVVQAIADQARQLVFAQMNCVIGQPTLDYVAALREVVPEGLDGFFLSNSGAEAVEAAIKLARVITRRPNVIAFQGGFHGRTHLGMALTSSKSVIRAGYQPLPPGVFVAPFPYAFRYGWPEDETVKFCLGELEHLLATQTSPGETAALLVEPVLGEGGYVPAPDSFLRGLRAICDHNDLLLIIDEIQTGFGRTGSYWAHQPSGVRPDVLVMAKGMGSGMPISAIAAPRALMKEWAPGSHGGTYGGGNAVVMAAARATLEVIESEGLVDNARAMGTRLVDGLEALAARFGAIADVRGRGLMAAVELARDGKPAGDLAKAVTSACAASGLLVLTAGYAGQVVRFVPPLIVSEAELDEALAIFEAALEGALAP